MIFRIHFVLFLAFIAENGWARLAVVQGATDQTSTQIAVLLPADQHVEFSMRGADKTKLKPFWHEEVRAFELPFRVVHLFYNGMRTGVSYTFHITDEKKKLLDERQLSTLETDRKRLKVGIASCMNDAYSKDQKGMWRDFLAKKPEVIFLIGDNVYADQKGGLPIKGSPAAMFERYVETRNVLELFKSPKLIPIFAVWDDHDYGLNEAGTNHPFKDRAYDILHAFFPRKSLTKTYEKGPGVAASLVAFGQRFVFMDGRTFRDGEKKRQFGTTQESWLLEQMAADRLPTWIINGSQFFGAYHQFNSFEGEFPEDFKNFLSQLKKADNPLFFLSGDRHLAELMEINKKELGFTSYELTTSAIHAKTYPSSWEKQPNPRQIAGAANELNYAMVSTNVEKGWDMLIDVYGRQNKKLFSKKVTIKR